MTNRWNHRLRAYLFRLGAILLALLMGSGASLCARQQTESEIAKELFGMIAEQSGCKEYAVAWFDRVKQHVEIRCAVSLAQTQQMLVGLTWQARFLVNIQTARAECRHGAGASLPQSATVLAHLLTVGGDRRWSRRVGAPLLMYRHARATSKVEVPDSRTLTHDKHGTIFVFSE